MRCIIVSVFSFLCMVTPSMAAPGGAANIREERRSIDVPNLDAYRVKTPSDEEKKICVKAIRILLEAEARDVVRGAPLREYYKGLMDKMPKDLPHHFEEVLRHVVEGLDKISQGNNSYWNHMDLETEMTVRGWLFLEAYCRRFLGFSLEMESLKFTERLFAFMDDSSPEIKGEKFLKLKEKINLIEQGYNNTIYENTFNELMNIALPYIPDPGYAGSATNEQKQKIMNWYTEFFTKMIFAKKRGSIEFRDIIPDGGKTYFSCLSGRDFLNSGVSFDGLPEDLKKLLEKECEAYLAFKKNNADAEDKVLKDELSLRELAYNRNKRLIELTGLGLDEYCGFMFENIWSQALGEKKPGCDWRFYVEKHTKEEEEQMSKRHGEILETWKTNGVPPLKYLGPTELNFIE